MITTVTDSDILSSIAYLSRLIYISTCSSTVGTYIYEAFSAADEENAEKKSKDGRSKDGRSKDGNDGKEIDGRDR